MLVQLEEKDESKNREMGNVEELADVRKSLDELAGERARLQQTMHICGTRAGN